MVKNEDRKQYFRAAKIGGVFWIPPALMMQYKFTILNRPIRQLDT